MALAISQKDAHTVSASTMDAPIAIVGTGPVGMRTAQELLKLNPNQPLVIYGNEPWEPYNRVRLSSFMAGQVSWNEMLTTLKEPIDSDVIQHHNCAIVSIDRERREITDVTGNSLVYSKLILAVGSKPHIPNIPGIDKAGVYTFRDMNDVQGLMARRARTRRTVVLGGGLLGIEAARALQKANTEVVIVEHLNSLMNQQLEEEAAGLLLDHIRGSGIEVVLGDGVKQVIGDNGVSGVQLRSGRMIPCDTLVLSTGIRPNIELARQAHIKVGRGIHVDDQMRSSDPHIFAVGECVEHRGEVYGLVGPGLEQAAVLAHTLNGEKVAYKGSTAVARLKVLGFPILSMGVVLDNDIRTTQRVHVYRDGKDNIYRKLVTHRGRLVGVEATGPWADVGRVQEAVSSKRRLYPWQLIRFRKTGLLWPADAQDDVRQWPVTATVCNCTGVTRGSLSAAVAGGCTSYESLAQCTGASTVCGTCKPLVAQMVGETAEPVKAKGRATLTAVSIAALIIALLLTVLSPWQYAETVQGGWKPETLWLDGFYKQVSGFTLLGLSALGLLISMRKRIRKLSLIDYGYWRVAHSVLGGLALVTLLLHTGLSFGDNLNFLLMSCFVGLAIVGAVSGMVTAMESGSGKVVLGRWRRCSTWTHIALFWPLPVLLGFHIAKTYYF